MKKITHNRQLRRKRRVSSNIVGTKERPRVSVFVSNKYIYAQLIDDQERKTLTSFSSVQLKKSKSYKREKKVQEAKMVGAELAKISQKKGIMHAILDRGLHSYKGRIKSLTEGLREGGLKV
ncbi:50S ribosomal protein L18 [Candidatus Roizmanbacteria bacterium]|nr:50S ribosomal protein L18 [Candidatus Roizmanbacteria bacterium]